MLHVPLVLRLPFAIEPVRIATQVRNLDIAPTLLELARRGESAGASRARRCWPLVPARRTAPDRPSFAALGAPLYPDAAVAGVASPTAAGATRGASRPIRAPARSGSSIRRVDPGENVDLARREPDEAGRLRAAARRAPRGAVRSDGARARDVRIDPSIAERLRAMGYLR